MPGGKSVALRPSRSVPRRHAEILDRVNRDGVPTDPTDVVIQLGGAQPLTTEINVYAELLVQATDGWNGGTATMNFEHTAKLALTVPDGYTFTSESGMLLAPEPSATLQALAACGAGLVVSRRKRFGATHEPA